MQRIGRLRGLKNFFGGLIIGTCDNFTEGDPSKFLRTINDHMPTAAANKLVFIERTGHTYQQKHREIADALLKLATDWATLRA